MTAHNSDNSDQPQASEKDAVPPGYEATMLVNGGNGANGGTSLQDQDLAFAACILKAGLVTERRMARAISTWTIHGNRRLPDHLVSLELISPADRTRFLKEATTSLEKVDQRITSSGQNYSHTQITRSRINQLDPSGRVSRLLGLNGGTTLVLNQSRKADCEFTLIRKLGEGGLGTVWLARDENLHRYVAIKELRQHGTDPAAARRFQREAEITGRLEHPGIVPIYQFGNDPATGRFFYVMRFLGKSTLQDAINEYHERRESGNDEPVLRHRLLTAFVNLCKAVAHAHDRKVIHRDLKPENVAMNRFGQIVLLDWGLARYQDEVSDDMDIELADQLQDSADMTMAGQVLGSPMWMSPEQAAGRISDIDRRTDVYGLGGILYSVLTGLAPHEKSHANLVNSGTSDASALLSAIVEKDVPPARSIVGTVPPELDAICRMAMARKSYLRYQTANALANDVESFLAGGNVVAYKASTLKQVQVWLSEHPRFSQAMAGILIFLTLFSASVYVTRQRTDVVREQAEFNFLHSLVQEMEFSLHSDAHSIMRDLRFISNLPPVQQIVREEEVHLPPAPASPRSPVLPSVYREDPESASKFQLSEIFTSLLRGHESYLSMSFARMDSGTKKIEEYVRSDRAQAGSWVRAVPESRLKMFVASQSDMPVLKPNDVVLGATADAPEAAPTQLRNGLVIYGATPVYSDTSGSLFGVMLIEMDLRYLVRKQLEAISHDRVDLFICDASGKMLMRYLNGELVNSATTMSMTDMFPELETMVKDPELKNWSDDRSLVAKRVILGNSTSPGYAEIIVIARYNN